MVKKGNCEQCGRKSNLRNVKDKSVCPTCGMLRGMVSKRPEAVIEVLKEFGNMAATVNDVPNNAGDGQVIQDLRNKLENSESVLASNKHLLSQIMTVMQIDDWALVDDLPHLVRSIRDSRDDADRECEQLRAMLEENQLESQSLETIIKPMAGYESLAEVLTSAMAQAATGKGKSRHAQEGVPFERQKICRITRDVGLGYPLGQAMKKTTESRRLGDRGPNEILGAINYLAAAYLVMDEELKAYPMQELNAPQDAVVEM